MARAGRPPSMAGRVLPFAAATALVVVATSVGLARHRTRPPREHAVPARSAIGSPSPVPAVPHAREAPLPSAPRTRPERRTIVATLGPIAVAVTLVLTGLGVGLVGVALASQRQIAAPPTPAASSMKLAVPTGREVEGWHFRPLPAVVTPPHTEPAGPTPEPAAPVLPRSRPMSLHIPAIGVRSVIRALGQADDGTLQTPQPGPGYNDAAWYRHSPTPGSLGPSILLGHVDSAAEGPSVFFRLGELTAGDRVAVTRADGSVAVFRVDVVRRYAKDNFPTAEVYGNIDHAGLRIVTCGGAFDNSSGHYLDNVVVFASLVGSPQG